LLWFLPTIFLATVLSRLVLANLLRGKLAGSAARKVAALVAAAAFCALGVAMTAVRFKYDWPWNLNIALIGAAFMLTGYVLKDSGIFSRVRQARVPVQLGLFALLLAATVLIARMNIAVRDNSYGRVVMALGYFGSPVLFFVGGVVGTLKVSMLAMLLERGRPLRLFFASVGTETMTILAIHNTIRTEAERYLVRPLDDLWASIAFSLAVLLVSWGIAIVLRKLAPSLVSGNVALVEPKKPRPVLPGDGSADTAGPTAPSA
jgi:fucose 4-O-acetylase-like acetyltransferase